MGIRAVSLNLRGRVQGVGFRWSARAQALALGLVGWVRNEDDGSLTIVVQGEPDAVDAFENWAGEGPGFARVRQVIRTEAQPSPLRGFSVH